MNSALPSDVNRLQSADEAASVEMRELAIAEAIVPMPDTSPANAVAAPTAGPLLPSAVDVVAVAAVSILGTATRVALNQAAANSGFYKQDPYFLVNAIGCFIMGFAVGSPLKLLLPRTFLMVTVAYCGCLTTMSSLLQSVSVMATFTDAVGRFIVGLTVPFVFYVVGRDGGYLVPTPPLLRPRRADEKKPDDDAVKRLRKHLRHVDLAVVVACGCVAFALPFGSHFAGAVAEGTIISWSIAPLGALPRFLLCFALNTRIPGFPLGTLLSNICAALISAGLSHSRTAWAGYAAVGICGSLSTVSGWVNDTVSSRAERKATSYLYAFVTIVVCTCIHAVGTRSIH
jgi:fluoride ion exporter CrcB/FEX